MILRCIKVRSFGGIRSFEADIYADVVTVFGRMGEMLMAAVRVLCGVPLTKTERRWLREDTVLEAELHGKRAYRVRLEGRELRMTVTDLATGADCTEDYRRATSRCEEECATYVFSRRSRDRYREQLYRYLEALPSASSDGLGVTEAFHRYTRRFVHGFSEEPLRPDKPYVLGLREDGRFAVCRREDPWHETVTLSETEAVLFSFLCYLHLVRFWKELRHTVDLHRESMPLIVEDFAEYIDESVPLLPYLHRLRRETRQMLLCLPRAQDAARLADWPSVQRVGADAETKDRLSRIRV